MHEPKRPDPPVDDLLLLDPESWEAPRRLSSAESEAALGHDWLWLRNPVEKETDDD